MSYSQIDQPQTRGNSAKTSLQSSKRPGTLSSAEPKPSSKNMAQLELFKSLNESRIKEIHTLNAKLSQAEDSLKKANAEALTFKKQIAVAEKTIEALTAAAAQPKKANSKKPATQNKSANPSRPTTATNKVIRIPASNLTSPKKVKPSSANSLKSVVQTKTNEKIGNKNNKGENASTASSRVGTANSTISQPKKVEAKKEVASKPATANNTNNHSRAGTANSTIAQPKKVEAKKEVASIPASPSKTNNHSRVESANSMVATQAKKIEAKKQVLAAPKPTSAISTSAKQQQKQVPATAATKKSDNNDKNVNAKSNPKTVKKPSNSSPVDNTPPVWENYMAHEQKSKTQDNTVKAQQNINKAQAAPSARSLVVKPQATPFSKDQVNDKSSASIVSAGKVSKPQTPIAKPQVQAKQQLKKENTNSKPSTAASSASTKAPQPNLGGKKAGIAAKEPGNILKPTTAGNKSKGMAGKN